MVNSLTLTFPIWNKEFYVHVDASHISLGVILAQLGEGKMDDLFYFSSRNIS